jgi:hypothetical protein
MAGGYGQPNMQVMNNHYDRKPTQQPPYPSPHYNIHYQQDARSRPASRTDEEARRRRSRSNHRSSRSNSDYRTPQDYNYNTPMGGVSNNVTPPSPTPEPSQSAASQLDAAQRRPAYLLHRDLVIGKGSYGQVCIASRGEAEGHSGGKSGKRKKFACKCVMLRNDPKYIAKLQEEVNVLRELRGHDNVIRLYDVFCVDNELFIITELGRGGDLFHLLTTHPKHGVTEAYAGEFLALLDLGRFFGLSKCTSCVYSKYTLFHSHHSFFICPNSQNCGGNALRSGVSPLTQNMPSRPQTRKLGP